MEYEKEEIEVAFQPIGLHVKVAQGATVLAAAQQGGVKISAVCGGRGSCGACRVRLDDQGQVSKPSPIEIETFDGKELKSGMRLACQTKIFGAVRVDVPPETLTATQRTQVEGEEIGFDLEPPVKIEDLALSEATICDLTADFERLVAAVSKNGSPPPDCRSLGIIKQIPGLLRGNQWKIRVGVRGDELVVVTAPGTPVLGLAVDIGTTKVAGYLVDMASGATPPPPPPPWP